MLLPVPLSTVPLAYMMLQVAVFGEEEPAVDVASSCIAQPGAFTSGSTQFDFNLNSLTFALFALSYTVP
uniref:Putative secreted protein n=1 Tax=Anopheles triannulatus TaxID=58253 RepID=A0A2M4B411_9DIPT